MAICCGISACALAPNYSNIPEIEFAGLSKQSMKQGLLFADSLDIYVNFKDGDGDLGSSVTSDAENLFLIDSRTGETYGFYKVPVIPEQGANNGVEGSMIIKVYSTCCIYPENIGGSCDTTASVVNQFPINDLSLDIYILDRAGNKSNVVKTTNISLLCK